VLYLLHLGAILYACTLLTEDPTRSIGALALVMMVSVAWIAMVMDALTAR